MKNKKEEAEKSSKSEEKKSSKSSAREAYKRLIEAYKKSNPVKAAQKADEFARKLAKLK